MKPTSIDQDSSYRGSQVFSIELNPLDIEVDVTIKSEFLSKDNYHIMMLKTFLFQFITIAAIITATALSFYNKTPNNLLCQEKECLLFNNDLILLTWIILFVILLIFPSIWFNMCRGFLMTVHMIVFAILTSLIILSSL